jgi:glycosyltransferase involved in cell wall biosynthesis
MDNLTTTLTSPSICPKPRLSIVIPVYNGEKYLPQCLESILSQTFSDFEIIIVDDGSNDSTGQILDNFAMKDSRIRPVHQKNGGSASARNTAISMVKADYLSIIDADDVLDSDMFEVLFSIRDKTNSDVCACSYVIEEGKEQIAPKEHQPSIPNPIVFNSKKEILKSMVGSCNSISGFVWNKIYKRSIVGDCRFKEGISFGDDVLFSWQVLSNPSIAKVAFINLPMYHYRIINSSVTRTVSYKKRFDMVNSYEYMLVDSQNIDPEITKNLAISYIGQNCSTFCSLVQSSQKDFDAYSKIKGNIFKYKKYVKYCSLKIRLLSRSLLVGYAFAEKTFKSLLLLKRK